MEDEIINFSFVIYPNPTSDFVTVVYALHLDTQICIELYNIFGYICSCQRGWLNWILDKVTIKNGHNSLEAHIAEVGINHQNEFAGNPSLLRSGVLMLLAIAFHNLPEGIAIGAAGAHNIWMGRILAVTIALHCIPEGMAIASPLIGGGMTKVKAITLTALSGTPTILGGIIGMWFGGISEVALALALTGAGGAMLYVVFSEVLPQSSIITKSRFTTYAALGGIIVGLLITSLH